MRSILFVLIFLLNAQVYSPNKLTTCNGIVLNSSKNDPIYFVTLTLYQSDRIIAVTSTDEG
ncbi:hypothetical protein [Yeosuana marina]|uniref:hypothetical protein n=1 Tax=Yeosuana marina TaxID=1565536 RepID=UPI00141E97D8|nr:hypothetical protein [Yeosuana marina]